MRHTRVPLREVDCSLTDEVDEVDEGAWVECGYLWTTDLHRITNHEATSENLTFVIEDGLTQRARSQGNMWGLWDQWLEFLRSEDPDFRSVVIQSLRNEPESTRMLVEGMPEHLAFFREWVEIQEG